LVHDHYEWGNLKKSYFYFYYRSNIHIKFSSDHFQMSPNRSLVLTFYSEHLLGFVQGSYTWQNGEKRP
jgi:hypothetical protein